ncbi:MAG: peptide chain release factor 1 [Chloroflexi bacterium]|nr:peptide chain release factor 1 [Chloroflexota bacterium]MDA1146622.1 peptide chain release factor 1 [Chloroflexota bacterium]MQC82833.1 peptide chain release factor 1 [Chloroflexota bacterium]
MLERLAEIEARYQELTDLLSDPDVLADHRRIEEISRERASLQVVVDLYRAYRETESALTDARALLDDDDAEMEQLGRDEEARLAPELEDLEQQLKVSLLPKDPADERNVIVEIRSGAGGDEAGLFAADLFRMYQRYAERRNWKVEVLNTSAAHSGGFKEITFELTGQGAFSRLKYESGVHRVQRVPETESQGRIHTSTATVAVLPEVDDIDVDINWNEVRIDIFHSGGAGGQNVNKVATAVRMTHEPTGLVVVCQDERSQSKNRARAESVLRARIYELERQRREDEESAARRLQVGSGDRAEKIRTYNFPQDRITDHRVNLTIHGMPRVLDGELDDLIEAVSSDEEARLLAAAS